MKLGIAGCSGRMGKMLIEAVRADMRCQLTATSARAEGLEETHTYLQREGLTQVLLTDQLDRLAEACDAIIDFTAPEYSLAIADACADAHTIHICGTTGVDAAQEQRLREAATECAMVKASNFSLGINLLMQLAERAAQLLGETYDVEIIETHHRYKKDAPSGTALSLAESVAKGHDSALDDVACYGRKGIVGERPSAEIGIHAVRGGDVIGDHTVLYAGDGERIELTHKSSKRKIYADGAIRAALWAKDQPYGLYSMQDVLR